MAARALWKGTLSFGLVEIPISLLTAEKSGAEISFTLLDKRDLQPVGYERVNKKTGEKVPWEQIVRGYEHEKGEYVVMTDEELERANAEASQAIEILEFVDAAEIEPLYYEKPYYVAPARKDSRAYALLRETLRRTNRVGVAKVVLRAREHLAVVGVHGPAIVVNLVRYAHELKDPKDLELPEEKEIRPNEVKTAQQLVEGMTAKWDPEQYRDEYRDDVLALVEKKVRAGKTTTPIEIEEKPRRRASEVLDLMPLLKKSLARTKRSVAASPRRAPRTTTRRKKKTA